MTHLLSDVRYAWRGLRQSPVFTLVAVVSIALGIGANTAIFTLVDQALLRLLPVKNPRQLVLMTPAGYQYGNNWGDGTELSYPMFEALRDRGDAFAGMFCRFSYPLHVSVSGRIERVRGELVSGAYFDVLGVRPQLGRLFSPNEDDAPGAHAVAVLSHIYWSTQLGRDPAIVGKSILVNSVPMTIVGVTQEGFDGLNLGMSVQIFVPITMAREVTPLAGALRDSRMRFVNVFARLRQESTFAQAQARLQPLYAARLQAESTEAGFAAASANDKTQFLKGHVEITTAGAGTSELRRMASPLLILMTIVGCVLLISCANVANLLLARGSARQREIAVRLALGATRGRIIQQLLVESLLLALAGGVAGLMLAAWGANVLIEFFRSPEYQLTLSATPDPRILGFTLVVSVATGLLFGLLPALRSTRPALAPTLKNEAGSILGGGHARLRGALVVAQVALSLLLLTGAGLLIRDLRGLLAAGTGLDTTHVMSFEIDPTLSGHKGAAGQQFVKTLIARMQSTPGVLAAGSGMIGLLRNNAWNNHLTIEGHTPKPDERVSGMNNAITRGYFAALGMPLLAGRDFDERDERMVTVAGTSPSAAATRVPAVAIVNETFVAQYLHGRPAIGLHIGFGRDPGTPTPIEIIGVVRDAKYTHVREQIQPQVFVPLLAYDSPSGMTVYARTQQPPETMFQTLAREVRQIDPNLPILEMQTFEQRLAQSLRLERLAISLSTIFGLLATLLATVGLYGVMSYSVARRTREIGIRMALGARTSGVAAMVLREGARLIGLGLAIGLPAAWALNRVISSRLYGLSPTDLSTMGAAALVLASVAMVAGFVPAWRAARVEPLTALRRE